MRRLNTICHVKSYIYKYYISARGTSACSGPGFRDDSVTSTIGYANRKIIHLAKTCLILGPSKRMKLTHTITKLVRRLASTLSLSQRGSGCLGSYSI